MERLLELKEKICELLSTVNKYQWEICAERAHVLDYHNVLLYRLHNRWKRRFFTAVRPLGLKLFFRVWRCNVKRNRRQGFGKYVTGIMVGFLTSSLGA